MANPAARQALEAHQLRYAKRLGWDFLEPHGDYKGLYYIMLR